MRQRQSRFIIYLLLLFMITGPACSLASHLADRAMQAARSPTPTRRWRPALPPAGSPAAAPVAKAGLNAPASPTVPAPTLSPTPTATPRAAPPVTSGQAAVAGNSAAVAPGQPAAPAVVVNPTAPSMSIPIVAVIPTSPPALIPTPAASPDLPPGVTPSPTLTPVPDYDYMLAEFFNSPTTNNFLLIYVAIVDPNEIPIGGMKIVGTRLDHNLTYESPVSTWHYEGYSAPGHVIKSGNVKFEPPGGIETTGWTLHLEDAHGHRQSADIPFEVDENDKQWYFIKFRRKF